ncbi:unnamed protein product, partial [Sphagnum balticum]
MMRTLVFEDISRRWGFLMMHYVHTLLKSCNQGIFACGSSVWSSPFPIEDANSANTSFRKLDNGCQLSHLLYRERVSAGC